MIALIIILFFALLITSVLILPINMVANSEQNEYHLSMPVFFKASILNIEEGIRVRVLFIKFDINNKTKSKRKNSKPETKKIKQKKSRNTKKIIKLVKLLAQQFKVKKCYANIDTGNFPLNAQLIPITNSISNRKMSLNINFEDENEVDIHIITRIGALLTTFLKHRIITYKN